MIDTIVVDVRLETMITSVEDYLLLHDLLKKRRDRRSVLARVIFSVEDFVMLGKTHCPHFTLHPPFRRVHSLSSCDGRLGNGNEKRCLRVSFRAAGAWIILAFGLCSESDDESRV